MSQSHVNSGSRAGWRSACLVLLATIVAAGVPQDAAAQQGDREAVLAVIDRLFDAMRANDGDGVRAVFADGASLISTEGRDGSPQIAYIDIERFATAVGGATQPFDEPYWDPIIQIQDNLATVWMKYAFYLGEEFSHCGVDAAMLARGPDGWKIVALADTREQANCELPPDRQPIDG